MIAIEHWKKWKQWLNKDTVFYTYLSSDKDRENPHFLIVSFRLPPDWLKIFKQELRTADKISKDELEDVIRRIDAVFSADEMCLAYNEQLYNLELTDFFLNENDVIEFLKKSKQNEYHYIIRAHQNIQNLQAEWNRLLRLRNNQNFSRILLNFAKRDYGNYGNLIFVKENSARNYGIDCFRWEKIFSFKYTVPINQFRRQERIDRESSSDIFIDIGTSLPTLQKHLFSFFIKPKLMGVIGEINALEQKNWIVHPTPLELQTAY